MRFPSISFRVTIIALIVLAGFIQSKGQNLLPAKYIYKFNEETNNLYENSLVSDGTWLYDILYDGGINGGGSIFKIRMDGSGYSVIFNFENNSTGLNPIGTLVLDGATLYGMTTFGGANNLGIIYKISTDGTGFQTLLDFNGTNGELPYCSLTLDGAVLYGVSQQGGTNSKGLIFSLQTDGTGYQTLLNFDGSNGWAPRGSITLSGPILYGVTTRGGDHDLGVVFSINADGSGFQKLVDFEQNTGSTPFGSLTLSGTTLYGTTGQGGPNYGGTLFKVETNGTNYNVIHYFGSDGINPAGKLVLDGSKIFGMTTNGGSYSAGAIYSVDTDGNNYTALHSFNKTDGQNPVSSLTPVDDSLYGHIAGGAHGYGVIFIVKKDGTEFQKLKDFEATNKGYEPHGGLALTKASGFGLTTKGGVFNSGVIYKVNSDGSDYLVLHDFDGDQGAIPAATLTLSGNALYGITLMGGSAGTGTLFKIDTVGNNFQVLVNFTGDNGSFPVGSLVDDGGDALYGMTVGNSTNNAGTVFRFNKGTGILTTLFSFEGTDAAYPAGGMTLANSKLYGMSGGGVGGGVVFSLNLDGSGFTKVLDKSSSEAGRLPNAIAVSGTTIYGTMSQGGTTDSGTVFKVETDGSGFQKLVDFEYGDGGESNGGFPIGATIVIGDSIIYGMTRLGVNDSGETYSVRTDGTEFTLLFTFDNLDAVIGGKTQASGVPVSVDGSLSYRNGTFFTPVVLQADLIKTGGIIKFSVDGTNVISGFEGRVSSIINVYPNPTTSVISLSVKSDFSQARVMDTKGNKMESKLVGDDSIDVSNLSQGMYFLIVGSKRYRFIKL